MTASTKTSKLPVYRVGPLEVHLSSDQALVYEDTLILTDRQFKILALLAANAEEIVGVLAIQQFCKSDGYLPQSIFLQIKEDVEAIRRKLLEQTNALSLESVRRVGYRLSAKKVGRNG